MPPAQTTSATTFARPRRQHDERALKQGIVRLHTITSVDGTVIEAWINAAGGPTVLVCNGLGTTPCAGPELPDPDCGIHVISWNHRGVGRSARPEDPSRVGVDVSVEDAIAVLDDAGVDRSVVPGWSFGVNTAFASAPAPSRTRRSPLNPSHSRPAPPSADSSAHPSRETGRVRVPRVGE